MSDGPTLPLAAGDPVAVVESGSSPLANPHLAAIDQFIAAKAAAGLSDPFDPADLLPRLQKAGLVTQQWGRVIFARTSAPAEAPALLVYVPSVAGQRYNLKAVLAAIEGWQTTESPPPIALKLLIGPVTPALLKKQAPALAASGILYSLGEYTQGRPLISLGLKGLLVVELRVRTMSQDAPSAYSEIMPSAAWQIVRALESIKSDAQEIKIEHFENDLAPLPVEESRRLLKSVPEHAEQLAQRLKQYGLDHYIFELGDALVLQTMYRVPTVNISAIECGTLREAGRLKVPATARARLDFQLVPDQHPDRVFELLKAHLEEKNFEGLELVRLPGALLPTRTPLYDMFVQEALQAAESAAGKPPLVAPVSPFSGPLANLKAALGEPPAICVGLAENDAAEADFAAHARFVARLLAVEPLAPAF